MRLGRVPNRMLAHLTNRPRLAIHSDVLTEPVVDLVERGVVTGPIVASLAVGTRRLYELIDGDPRFVFRPVDQVCDPAAIAATPRFVSITQAFGIDPTGQVCTELLDGSLYGASRRIRRSTAASRVGGRQGDRVPFEAFDGPSGVELRGVSLVVSAT